MSWFLVAVMATVYDGGKKDIYVWHTPQFENSNSCVEYVEQNGPVINGHLYKTFPNDKMEKLFCVPEDKLKRFFEDVKNQGKSSI